MTVIAAVLIAVGIVGVVVPVVPGTLLCVVGVLVWSVHTGGVTAWTVLGISVAVAAAGWGLKYLVPGRRLGEAGVPRTSLLAGAVIGVVGFFVIPYVGLPIGFVLGVYLAELSRVHDERQARAATWEAARAVAVSVGIELGAALLISMLFVAGLLLTR